MNLIYILKSFVIVFLIELAKSLEVNLNDLSLKTVSSLLNIVSKYGNDVKYVEIHPNKFKHNELNSKNIIGITDDYLGKERKFQKPGKHVLIKRLIPHGMPPSKLEFDSKYKTFYRPLVRVHKRKRVPKVSTILNIDGTTNGMDEYGIDVYDYYDNDENVLKFAINKGQHENFKVKESAEDLATDEVLLQPFTNNFKQSSGSPPDVSTQLVLLKDIQKLLHNIHSRSIKAKIYPDITKVLYKIISLRARHNTREKYNPMARETVDIDENEASKPNKWIPHYAPWNYWTYKKTIYEDVCPEGQVKISNLCVWIPPH